MTAREWRLCIDWCDRPTSANAWYGASRWHKVSLVDAWRSWGNQAAQLANLPKGIAGFEAEIQFRYKSGQLTDPDSAAPTWKAICDGLIDYGLAPDDTNEFFHGVKLLPAIKRPRLPHAVVVVIREVTAGEPVVL